VDIIKKKRFWRLTTHKGPSKLPTYIGVDGLMEVANVLPQAKERLILQLSSICMANFTEFGEE